MIGMEKVGRLGSRRVGQLDAEGERGCYCDHDKLQLNLAYSKPDPGPLFPHLVTLCILPHLS